MSKYFVSMPMWKKTPKILETNIVWRLIKCRNIFIICFHADLKNETKKT